MKNETFKALIAAAIEAKGNELAHAWIAGALSVYVSDKDALSILETLTGKAN